jgi:ABC-type transport system involved in cytochrome c biogenesis permease subunit
MKKNSTPNSTSPAPSAPKTSGWRVWLSWFLVILFAGEIAAALFVTRTDKTFAVSEFAKLPLTFNGRIQPMDSLARNSLTQIRGITEVPIEGNGPGGRWGTWEELRGPGAELTERRWHQFDKHPKKLKPADWLLEVLLDARKADDRYIFVINHPDLRGLLKLDAGVEKSGLHFYRFNDLRDRLNDLRPEVDRIEKVDASRRTPYDRAVAQLHNAWSLYMRLKNTLQPEDTTDFSKELDEFVTGAARARAAVEAAENRGEKLTDEKISEILGPVQNLAARYDVMARMQPPLVVPPVAHDGHDHGWRRTGEVLLESARSELPASIRAFAAMSTAYRAGNHDAFNTALAGYRATLESQGLTRELKKGANEEFFNRMLAFKRSMYVYITAFLLVLLYWANLNEIWRVTAMRLLGIGFVVHTVGLVFRMWLEGRPPVTNLYSSAIFIGWGALVLGLVLERFYRDGIGAMVASAVGFLSLIVAHNLAQGGDTMEMMRAVLDTNFWLATHVVVITLGYASTFVAGFLAIVYVMRGVFTKSLSEQTAKGLARMVYAIVCFATLFSFVGTVLGGIWADQSWGRFWGWDPKENGALIIVLWNVLILHARWGGMVRERGLMNMAIVGNIVTSWSWFGVNMLGIGLHSYGFMDSAFYWLLAFVGSQLALIGLGLIPLQHWRSFRGRVAETPSPTETTSPAARPGKTVPASA